MLVKKIGNTKVNSRGFPDSSAGKESICNPGDPDLIPGLGRSPGKGIGYPLQYSWAFQLAQMVKNSPAMQKTWARSLGWEGPLATGLEKVSFHSNHKERQCQRMFKLLHNCVHFICYEGDAQKFFKLGLNNI